MRETKNTLNSIKKNVCCISLYLYREKEIKLKQRIGGHEVFVNTKWRRGDERVFGKTQLFKALSVFCFLKINYRKRNESKKKKHNLCSCKVTLKY